ncbi:MAG: nitroreductase family protein, partial [Armatimonadota bacterium]
PTQESWRQRFGTAAPNIPGELSPFLNHRSVRRYTEEPISEEILSGLIAAAQSAATSSNLQSWSVISVNDSAKRQALSEACDHQRQVVSAPVFLVFLADLNRVEKYAQASGIETEGLDTAEMYTVAVIDAALAAERLVCAAEALEYGICYIGALRNEPNRVKELLNLPDKTFGVFGLCIGRPSETVRGSIKPKLRQDQVWFREEYPDVLDSSEYDRRMDEFFAKQGMANQETWSAKSGKRVQDSGLSGREKLLDFLRAQGLLKR